MTRYNHDPVTRAAIQAVLDELRRPNGWVKCAWCGRERDIDAEHCADIEDAEMCDVCWRRETRPAPSEMRDPVTGEWGPADGELSDDE